MKRTPGARLAWAPLCALLVLAACSGRRKPIAVGREGAPAVEVVEATAPTQHPKLPLIDEQEPDDDREHAQPLEPGKGIRGTLAAPRTVKGKLVGDEDWYSWLQGGVPRDAGFDEARIELSGIPGIDLALEIFDGDGKRLWLANDGGPGQPEIVPNLAVTPGHTYYARVHEQLQKGAAPKSDPAHAYELTVVSAPAPAGDEREPNDDLAHATPLDGVGDSSGFYGRRRDEDWLRVPLPRAAAESKSTLRLELGPVEGVVPLVRVQGEKEQLAEARGGRGEELRLRNVGLGASTGAAPSAVFVLVKASEGYSSEQRWMLKMGIEPALDGAEREPNNSPAQANELALAGGTAQVSGFLWPGDLDVFRVTGAAADALLSFDVDGVERVDLKLERISADGKPLVRADDAGAGQSEALPPWPVGDALIRVSARARDTAFEAPYRLTVTAAPPAPDEEREPNNNPTQATPWLPGAQLMRGHLAPRGDEDWYAFVGPPGKSRASVRVEGGPPAVARIVDEARLPLPPGGALTVGKRYYVVVKGASDKAASARDPYTVTLQLE
jgi:hypothetical protein